MYHLDGKNARIEPSPHVCGMDEAGRGPLAGPVTAGCVILGPGFPLEVLGDSKALTEKERDFAYKLIIEKALAWGIGWAWPSEIDKINILQASLLAMTRAYEEMNHPADKAYADGNFCPKLPISCEAVVRGDSLIPEISAASILAKVVRDRWMIRYSWIEEQYGFEKHKGYPTKAHIQALETHGPSAIHRYSFKLKTAENLSFEF